MPVTLGAVSVGVVCFFWSSICFEFEEWQLVNNEYKVIGINVSKSRRGERTGYVIPIYRFVILMKKLNMKVIFLLLTD